MMTMDKLDINDIKKDYLERSGKFKRKIIICAGTACVASGSLMVRDELMRLMKEKDLSFQVSVELKEEKDNAGTYISKSGCQGFCQMGPLVTILPENILYTRVKPENVKDIVEETLINNRIVDRLLYRNPNTKKHCASTDQIEFYAKQKRFVLKNCGHIDPEDINEYIAKDGYLALHNVLNKTSPEGICKEILESGLRGRGGGGFLTGKKWELTRIEKSEKKFIICNGDEGDPGAFMDRSVMEGNPHSVIEGMLIASFAIGADEGYVYVRMEYPLAVSRMKIAIKEAEKLGILGDNIFGTGHSFKLHVMEGAGAFVCGEETAMISSIEGNRGMPLPKPPFPAQSGLWGKPTVINNVETFATIPLIINMGALEYRKMGTKGSPGTKTFAVTGHVANTGLIEVPFGSTMRDIIFDIAGGVPDKEGNIDIGNFKAVQIGGPSGGCLTREHLDLPLDFDSLRQVGAMVGSGGLVIMNKETCMIGIAKYFMQLTQNESCGKCVLCREGTHQMLNLLNDIMEGRATVNTIKLLKELAEAVQKGSLCGLGKTAPNPVLSTLKYFYDEYMEHVEHKRCPTGSCKDLIEIKISASLCKGCTLCAKKCPAGAISGEKGKTHVIDKDLCTKCGICIATCKFKAISK
jgi:NADH-quinone oxidoreductase subunit F